MKLLRALGIVLVISNGSLEELHDLAYYGAWRLPNGRLGGTRP
jgi:hypothetical protein